MYSVRPFGPIRKIPCAPLARLTVLPVALAGPMLARAVMGFTAGAVVAVVEADVLGEVAQANEAPKAAKKTTLKATPAKIRGRPPVVILICSSFSSRCHG